MWFGFGCFGLWICLVGTRGVRAGGGVGFGIGFAIGVGGGVGLLTWRAVVWLRLSM